MGCGHKRDTVPSPRGSGSGRGHTACTQKPSEGRTGYFNHRGGEFDLKLSEWGIPVGSIGFPHSSLQSTDFMSPRILPNLGHPKNAPLGIEGKKGDKTGLFWGTRDASNKQVCAVIGGLLLISLAAPLPCPAPPFILHGHPPPSASCLCHSASAPQRTPTVS